MPLVPKQGYIYRFHQHHPGPDEPKPKQSPHISPGTSIAEMPNADIEPVPSAHYYPSTWEAHPMLPPGHMDADPRANLGHASARMSIIEVQPTPRTPMSVTSGSSEAHPGEIKDVQEGRDADEQEQSSWGGWTCCIQKKVARAARVV